MTEQPLIQEAPDQFTLPAGEIDEIRNIVASRPLRRYETLDMTPLGQTTKAVRRVNRLFDEGWRRDGRITWLHKPLPWEEGTQSYRFHLHAWEVLTFLLGGFDNFSDGRCLDTSANIARAWVQRYQTPFLDKDLMSGVAEAFASANDHMAWYDMAVGQRVYRLAYLMDVVARLPGPGDLFEMLYRSLWFHQELLSIDAFWKHHNNHGLYQALGQLAASRRFSFLPGFDLYRQKALERLRHMLKNQFCDSGIHREHSPFYHKMVMGSVLGAVDCGLVDDPELTAILRNAEEALGWMVTPECSMANIGD